MSSCYNCVHKKVCEALIENGLPYKDETIPAEALCLAYSPNNLGEGELKNCPFCKSDKLGHSIKTQGKPYSGTHKDRYLYRSCIYCKTCGAYGPYYSKSYEKGSRSIPEEDREFYDEAVKLWNGTR